MKFILCIAVLAISSTFSSKAQEIDKSTSPREFEMKEGDTTYIMKKYFLCLFTLGEVRNKGMEDLTELQNEHLNHINKMANEGVIHLAGPFESKPEDFYRGLLLFDTNTKEEAEEWILEDPMVKAKRLGYQILPWWGAKGSVLK